MSNVENLKERIAELKAQKRAIILAHYYTSPEVQQVADFTGDSLALSQKAASVDADVILFAGVKFMAETAKVLSPERTVLLPVPDAGCSLADSCDAERLAEWKREHPGVMVVSYVNTSVEVKAHTDICCTSSNALRVVQSIPADQPILFVPDRNLGSYIKKVTGRENITLWDGCCLIHEDFCPEGLAKLRAENPGVKVLAHPECNNSILEQADVIGSTADLLAYCSGSDDTFIVVTEVGILHEMQSAHPEKRFIPAPKRGGGCNECLDMKKVNLENICSALENIAPTVEIEEGVRKAAEGSILRMISLK